MLLITHHYHQLQTQFYFPTSSQRAADLKYHSLVSSALALILWHLKYICCLCLYQLNIFAAVSSSHYSLSTCDHNSDYQSVCGALRVCGCTKPAFCNFSENNIPHGFPFIDLGPELKVVEKSRTATMLCSASGNPDPEISWFKDMLPVNISSSDGRLKQLRSGRL